MPARRTAEFTGWDKGKLLALGRNPTPPLAIDYYNTVCLQWTQTEAGGTCSDIEIWLSADEDPRIKDFAGDPSGDGRFFRLKDDAGTAITFPDLPAGTANDSGGISFYGVGGAWLMLVFVVNAGTPTIRALSHVKEHGG